MRRFDDNCTGGSPNGDEQILNGLTEVYELLSGNLGDTVDHIARADSALTTMNVRELEAAKPEQLIQILKKLYQLTTVIKSEREPYCSSAKRLGKKIKRVFGDLEDDRLSSLLNH